MSSALVLFALPLIGVSANASEPRANVVGLTPLPTSDTVVSRVITTSFDLALAQPHDAALAAFIATLSNTASPNYHHFLTPGEYAARFGATSATVSAVRGYLRGYGLTTTLSAGRNILHVTGSTDEIAKAFDARVETVRRSNGALGAVLANKGSLPRSIAKDVTAVAGLSSVRPETSNTRTRPRRHDADGLRVSRQRHGHDAQQRRWLHGPTASGALRARPRVGRGRDGGRSDDRRLRALLLRHE